MANLIFVEKEFDLNRNQWEFRHLINNWREDGLIKHPLCKIPQLPRLQEPLVIIRVQLTLGTENCRILFRAADLYVLGFQRRNRGQIYSTKDEDNPIGGRKLSFKGDYTSLMTKARIRSLSNVEVDRPHLIRAMTAFNEDNDQRWAWGMLIVILLFSESLRFHPLQSYTLSKFEDFYAEKEEEEEEEELEVEEVRYTYGRVMYEKTNSPHMDWILHLVQHWDKSCDVLKNDPIDTKESRDKILALEISRRWSYYKLINGVKTLLEESKQIEKIVDLKLIISLLSNKV